MADSCDPTGRVVKVKQGEARGCDCHSNQRRRNHKKTDCSCVNKPVTSVAETVLRVAHLALLSAAGKFLFASRSKPRLWHQRFEGSQKCCMSAGVNPLRAGRTWLQMCDSPRRQNSYLVLLNVGRMMQWQSSHTHLFPFGCNFAGQSSLKLNMWS